MEALKLDNVKKRYGGLQVLNNLSLSIDTGELVAVIGPNGAGKTTLMNIITGGIKSDSGKVFMLGRDITTLPTHIRAHLGMGRSFQITHLCLEMTVLQNMLLALHGTRASRFQIFRKSISYSEIMEKARQLLKSIDLWEKGEMSAKAISYGEQRKLEIILSLAMKPSILLLDEPSAGLSINEIPLFIDTIKKLSAGTAVFLTSHDMDVVFGLAERVIVLYYGKIIARGTPEEVKIDPMVKEIYLGV